MGGRDLNLTALVAGVVFVLLGVLFLLDRLAVLAVRPSFVWPILLIGLGLAVILGGRRDRPAADEEPEGDRPPDAT